ncbi:leucine-rich repeat-containing protein 15-like [Limulus polyphemus]|uniref:Leucine-rich repeat-containing protein 15-like n=1 Tax=Limulus polyphemus TaxID=6850 RepID=A0ABM1TAL4_LIMPO|nr:leucine-rich repeat-containing protein 15-like [Limulus polyphemus]XP_022252920.1 leucine-rich repeat-containing protein 15-like [Limulus polyphemus]
MELKKLWKILYLLAMLWCQSKGEVDGENIVLCNSASANNSVYCTCDKDGMDEATDISCYIFGPVDRKNEFWKSFSRQSRVTTFMLTSRPSDPLQFVPMETLARIPLVEEIYIKESSLGVLEKNSFAYKDHLRTIILERNEITGLRKYAFSNLLVLTRLSLSENYIEELKKASFNHLPRLTFLFLDRNNITWIEDDAFIHLPNLSELELWDNKIRQLSPKSLAGLKSLRRLDLYKNHITILGDHVFHGTPRLQELDLKDNYISQISPHAFDGLQLLSTLYLNHNRLKELPDHAFFGTPNLRYLELSDNHLRIIQALSC